MACTRARVIRRQTDDTPERDRKYQKNDNFPFYDDIRPKPIANRAAVTSAGRRLAGDRCDDLSPLATVRFFNRPTCIPLREMS
jgi:hypothetical protein